ncbi:MAG TPA: hypothetical protein VGH89_34835, partial [Pseudonocardia sp.]
MTDPPASAVQDRDIAEIARNFHVFDPELAADPAPMLDRMRTECPVARSEMFGGYWVLTRYDHCRQVLSDPETFSSTVPIIPKLGAEEFLGSIPVTLDPPDHTGYRRILAPIFVPGRIAAMADEVRALARDLAARMCAVDGPFDFRG